LNERPQFHRMSVGRICSSVLWCSFFRPLFLMFVWSESCGHPLQFFSQPPRRLVFSPPSSFPIHDTTWLFSEPPPRFLVLRLGRRTIIPGGSRIPSPGKPPPLFLLFPDFILTFAAVPQRPPPLRQPPLFIRDTRLTVSRQSYRSASLPRFVFCHRVLRARSSFSFDRFLRLAVSLLFSLSA